MFRSLIIALIIALPAFAQTSRATRVSILKTPMEQDDKPTNLDPEAAKGFMAFLGGSLLCVSIVVTLFELIPWMIAVLRGHNNKMPIFLLCFFLGWTIIGWIIALIWAFTDNNKKAYRR